MSVERRYLIPERDDKVCRDLLLLLHHPVWLWLVPLAITRSVSVGVGMTLVTVSYGESLHER